MIKRRLIFLVSGLMLANSGFAANEPERVIFKLPPDFELGFKQDQGRQSILEYVPRGQKVTDWTRMVTVNRMDGSVSARAYAIRMLEGMKELCPGAKLGLLEGSNDESAGYVTSCPKSPQTGRPELTLYQTMRGWKYTHTVQVAFSGPHTKEVLAQPKDLLSSVRVCEEGKSDAACRASPNSGSQVSWPSFFKEEKSPAVKTTETRTPGGAKIVNHEVEGSLAPNAKIGCIAMKDVTNKMNPPALYMGARACLEAGRVDQALPLLATAGDYGFYDVNRLSDKTTGGAPRAAAYNAFSGLPKGTIDTMQARYRAFEADPAQVAIQCQAITKLGPPAYKPSWAINHGMSMFIGNGDKDPYLHDVDTQDLWKGIVKRRCTPRKGS